MRKLLALAMLVALPNFYGHSAEAKSVNVRVDPLTMLLGIFNAEVDIRVAQAWTVGPTVSFYNLKYSDTELSASSFGVRANYFLNGQAFTNGWYFGPQYKVIKAEAEVGSSSAESNGSIVGALMGYHWIWDTFNIQLGGGINSYSLPENQVTADGTRVEYGSLSGTSFAFEFSLGWAF